MTRLALALLGLLVLPTPLAVLALLCLLVLVAAEMPGRTWVRRGALAVLVVVAADAAALTALAVLHIGCRPRWLVAAELVLLLVWQRWRPGRTPVPTASSADLLSLAVGALTFAVLAAPLLTASVGRTMALMSRTTDGATHVQLLTAISRYHGYLHLRHPQGISAGVDHYPTGWHGTLWVLSDLLWGASPSSGQLVRLVAFAAVATYAAFGAASAWLAVSVAGQSRSWLRAVAAVAVLPVVLLGFGVFQLQLGSYSQTAALTVLLVLVAARRWDEPSARELVVLGSGAVVVLQGWYLYAPLVLVCLLPTVVRLRRRPVLLACSLLLVTPLGLYPLVTGPSAGHLDQPGPVLLPSNARIAALLVAFGAAAWWGLRQGRAQPARALTVAALAALSFTLVLVGVEDRNGSGSIPYYAAKLLLTSLVLTAVLACGLLVPMLAAGKRAAVTLLLVAGGLAIGAVSTSGDAWPPSMNPHTRFLDSHVLQAMYDDQRATRANGRQALVMQGCDRVWDRVATKWAPDTSLTWSPELAEVLVAYSLAAPGDVSMLRTYLTSPGVTGLDVYVRHPCDTDAVTELAKIPGVKVHRVP
jgi:hypothetical protein